MLFCYPVLYNERLRGVRRRVDELLLDVRKGRGGGGEPAMAMVDATSSSRTEALRRPFPSNPSREKTKCELIYQPCTIILILPVGESDETTTSFTLH